MVTQIVAPVDAPFEWCRGARLVAEEQ